MLCLQIVALPPCGPKKWIKADKFTEEGWRKWLLSLSFSKAPWVWGDGGLAINSQQTTNIKCITSCAGEKSKMTGKRFRLLLLSTCASCLRKRRSLDWAAFRLSPGVEPYSCSHCPTQEHFKASEQCTCCQGCACVGLMLTGGWEAPKWPVLRSALCGRHQLQVSEPETKCLLCEPVSGDKWGSVWSSVRMPASYN